MKSASEGSSHSLNSRSIQRRLTDESVQQTSHHKDVFEKLPTGKAIEVNDVSATEECLVLPCIHQNDNNAAISTKGGLSIARETRPTRVSSDVSDVEASLNRGETDEWIEIEEHVTRRVRRNNWEEAIADLDKLFTDEEQLQCFVNRNKPIVGGRHQMDPVTRRRKLRSGMLLILV